MGVSVEQTIPKQRGKPLRIALVGNPNCGKTTLFNALTGSTAHTGNWPGVTVERKEGIYRDGGTDVHIVDLPGVYSLSPYSPEEAVTHDYILLEHPDAIVNIVDVTNPERNLYLTSQLLETNLPVVVALNMMDMLEKCGGSVDTVALEAVLGVPAVPVTAVKKQGLNLLMERAVQAAQAGRTPITVLRHAPFAGPLEEIHTLLHDIDNALYLAVKVLEGDEEAVEKLSPGDAVEELAQMRSEGEAQCPGGDCEAAVADWRYRFITEHCSPLFHRPARDRGPTVSDRIDRIVTHRVLAIPVFLFMMFLMFHLTFTENLLFVTGVPGPGTWLKGLMEGLMHGMRGGARMLLVSAGAPGWAVALIVDGILSGVGAVMGFLPLVLVLYFFISVLEDSGYMARAAFIMDRLLRKIGLSGRAFVPLIMGFGCSVPAVSATRTLEYERDRRLTIMLIPFLSCGAKLPVYALIVPVFFPRHTEFAVGAFYLLGILAAILTGYCLKHTLFQGDDAPFILELPAYRMPGVRSLGVHLWDKLCDFAVRVGTVITIATILIWFLANFGFSYGSFGMVEANSAHSLLGTLGNALQFFFRPLGFASGPNGWKAVVSVLSGLVAREAVVSTMGQLYATTGGVLEDAIAATFSLPAAVALLTWNLLSTPCMAAVAAISREMRSGKWFWITMAFHVGVAWVISVLVYTLGTLFLM